MILIWNGPERQWAHFFQKCYTLYDGFCSLYFEHSGTHVVSRRLSGWTEEITGETLSKTLILVFFPSAVCRFTSIWFFTWVKLLWMTFIVCNHLTSVRFFEVSQMKTTFRSLPHMFFWQRKKQNRHETLWSQPTVARIKYIPFQPNNGATSCYRVNSVQIFSIKYITVLTAQVTLIHMHSIVSRSVMSVKPWQYPVHSRTHQSTSGESDHNNVQLSWQPLKIASLTKKFSKSEKSYWFGLNKYLLQYVLEEKTTLFWAKEK